MKEKKKQIVASIVAVLLLVLLTIGVTYAVFTYTKLGTTENTVTAGTLKFLYTENTGVGAGIKLEDALPVSDEVGKTYSTEGYVFDFSIEATNTGTEVIPYEVTLRKKSDSTLAEEAVKVYLTDMTEDADSELLEPTLYSNLVQTNIDVGDEIEKTIYTDSVTGNTTDYLKNFRLRMWVDENVDFSSGNYNKKTFTATVNVYSNVPLVSDEEISLRESANISSISVDGTEMTAVTDQDYDYKTSVLEGTTEVTLNIETENENATVTVEKADSLAYSNNSNIERMAVSKTVTLTDEDNYFKVTVTSQNKKVEKEYGIRISIVKPVALKDAILAKYTTIYENPTLTTSSNKTSDASGLYKSTDTNSGNPTYYFRGDVDNTIEFAGFTWNIVRINEDETVRLIMANGINNNYPYGINPTYSDYTYMYYSNSNVENGAKYILDDWYQTNIVDKEYSSYVATGDYFCEEAKVNSSSSYTSGSATMTVYSSYTPTFKCSTDGNGKGIINGSIGLITYDEAVYAGAYYGKTNSSYYLYNRTHFWTMSPGGVFSTNRADAWNVDTTGGLNNYYVSSGNTLRPVLILDADTPVTESETGTSVWTVV